MDWRGVQVTDDLFTELQKQDEEAEYRLRDRAYKMYNDLRHASTNEMPLWDQLSWSKQETFRQAVLPIHEFLEVLDKRLDASLSLEFEAQEEIDELRGVPPTPEDPFEDDIPF